MECGSHEYLNEGACHPCKEICDTAVRKNFPLKDNCPKLCAEYMTDAWRRSMIDSERYQESINTAEKQEDKQLYIIIGLTVFILMLVITIIVLAVKLHQARRLKRPIQASQTPSEDGSIEMTLMNTEERRDSGNISQAETV